MCISLLLLGTYIYGGPVHFLHVGSPFVCFLFVDEATWGF
jgi:hypothetical protein